MRSEVLTGTRRVIPGPRAHRPPQPQPRWTHFPRACARRKGQKTEISVQTQELLVLVKTDPNLFNQRRNSRSLAALQAKEKRPGDFRLELVATFPPGGHSADDPAPGSSPARGSPRRAPPPPLQLLRGPYKLRGSGFGSCVRGALGRQELGGLLEPPTSQGTGFKEAEKTEE